MEMNRIQLFNVVVVCFTYVLHVFFFFFDVVFFWGWGATNFPGEVPLLERVHVRQDCHCKCAAEYIQMSLITGRAPCQTDQQ